MSYRLHKNTQQKVSRKNVKESQRRRDFAAFVLLLVSLCEIVFLAFACIILYHHFNITCTNAKALHVIDRGHSTGSEYRTA